MADSPSLPSERAWRTQDGKPLPVEFFRFFRDLLVSIQQTDGNTVELSGLIARVTALEESGGTVGDLLGDQSVQVFGSLADGEALLRLVNDAGNPGLTKFYGTDALGVKGWQAVSDALAQGDGITLTVNPDGTTNIAHADTSSVTDISANFTGGTVPAEISLTFDQFGHVLTRTITGRTLDHNDTGALQGGNAAERYHFTETEHSGLLPWAAEAPGDYEPTIAPGNTGQLWRGDKTWSNTIDGSFSIDGNTGSPGMLPGLFGLYLAGPDNVPAFAHFDGFGQSGGLLFRAANGTNAAKTALIGSQLIGQFQGRGYDGATYSAERVSIQYRASQAWTGAAQGTRIHFRTTANDTTTILDRWLVENSGHLMPFADNAYALGGPSNRTSVVYSATGAINTSDAREKTIRGPLTPAELAAATELASAGVIYQWNHAIEEKGDAARLHFGPTVQAVIAIMQSHGLDPFRYGFVCYDQWDELPEIVEDGEVVQPYRPAGDRYSLRHDQLALFIHTGAAQERAAMRERISRLEALLNP